MVGVKLLGGLEAITVVGEDVGLRVGEPVLGRLVGALVVGALGAAVGAVVGHAVGDAVGDAEGAALGPTVPLVPLLLAVAGVGGCVRQSGLAPHAASASFQAQPA